MSADLPALRATLRLQLHKGFPFAAAAERVPYFAALGISHLYLSPIMTARAGSTHGYDVVDPHNVNPELGGEDGYRALVARLREHGMGVIVDIVPNHMAVGRSDNQAWLDVLEWGRLSRHAEFFDIDWDVPDPALRNRLLAPFLGKPYGEALADGELKLVFDRATGRFRIEYYEHHFPVSPESIGWLLRHVEGDRLAHFAEQFVAAARTRPGARGSIYEQVCTALCQAVQEDPATAGAMDALLARFEASTAAGASSLHRLLERQHYRLAWWRTAPDEINWRRFFDIIELAGVRMQSPAAFELLHGTLFRLYAEGLIDGLRIDHIDGLADPRTYCRRLRQRLERLDHERPPGLRTTPYLLVEKILAVNEDLPTDWKVDGSTGYSFMNEVGALLHDPRGEAPLTELWNDIAGPRGDFERQEMEARRRIPQQLLASDFNACARALHAIARSDPATRDWTLFAIRRVLAEILVHLPVYRTYADARGRGRGDAAIMAQTIEAARPDCRPAERPLLDLVDRWLGGEAPNQLRSIRARRARLHAIGRFQQLSSPVAAKAVEDTVFYRHGRLLSRNEVGANPAQFALSADEFHAQMEHRVRRFPRAMLATATHDHKRGEDLRARLAVISELPSDWTDAVGRWRSANMQFKPMVDERPAPDPIDEYMLYQMLLGAWPLDLRPDDHDGVRGFAERIAGWQLKALREAKRHSSWAEPNEAYEAASREFLDRLLQPASAFIDELHALVERVAVPGAINGLAQTLLKIGCPGVCDFYQGCERWDFSLVDPDNRRPVDFDTRQQAIDESAQPIDDAGWSVLLAQWRDGRVKQALIRNALAARQALPGTFVGGPYRPLKLHGPQAGNALAFARLDPTGSEAAVVIVARFCAGLLDADAGSPYVDSARWQGTTLQLPRALHGRQWRSALLAGQAWRSPTAIDLGLLLSPLPVQLLLSTA